MVEPKRPLLGAPGMKTFLLTGNKPCSGNLRLALARLWEWKGIFQDTNNGFFVSIAVHVK